MLIILISFVQSGKYAKAVTGFEAILALLLKRYGESHHRVGAALHNVAIANLRAGQLDEAVDAIEEAVRIRKITLGKDSPKVAVSREGCAAFKVDYHCLTLTTSFDGARRILW